MDEVRRQWEELMLLLQDAQERSEKLGIALQEVRPVEVPWDDANRMAWRTWWDTYCQLDIHLWNAYCRVHQAPQWAEFDLS